MKTVVQKSGDTELRLVWGVVVAPNRPIEPDKGGEGPQEYMTADAIRELAHGFMIRGLQGQVDVQHQQVKIEGCTIVESFIARYGDPDFPEGSWVVCCHVDDDFLWERIKSGEINAFSLQALVYKHDVVVELDIPPIVNGTTNMVEGHYHTFVVQYGIDGEFLGGHTDETIGAPDHKHNIVGGCITQPAAIGVVEHVHRFSSVDNVLVHEILSEPSQLIA